ncbi:uncharacterized protein [Drosophila tropicalis]|uniref:uncharacterized protein n=1 Tax=Drosophila tropicalis TaxID=46794 RepID=UPI0035AC0070
MGPELPTDPGELDQFSTPAIPHPVETETDDSDDAYNGYEPLAMEDEPQAAASAVTTSPEDDDKNIDLTTAEVTHGDPNMPPIEPVDAEIERQVWNEPRPRELQIELDKTKTDQILSAMSKITLPNITVPDWAKGVPEESWKQELLDRIQNRQQQPKKDAFPSSSSSSNK